MVTTRSMQRTKSDASNNGMTAALAATLVTNVDYSFGVAALWPLVSHHGGDRATLATAASVFAIARLLGTPLAGLLADKVRTKTLLLGFLLLYAVSAMVTVLATGINGVFAARIAAGVGICLLGVINKFVVEGSTM